MSLTRLAVHVATAAGLAAGLAAHAGAADVRVGDVVISKAWARASVGAGRTAAAYVTITNHADEADRLVAVEAARAERAEVHTTVMEGEVMRMRPVEAIELAPGATTVLEPGGDHIMLMGLATPLEEGESFELSLKFETAGSATLTVDVAGVGAMGPASGHMHQAAEPITVMIHRVSPEGVHDAIGTITVHPTSHGLTLQPSLAGLEPGLHAFHVHTNPDCRPAMKDGRMVAALAAGGHFDPAGAGHGGHEHGAKPAGDLPELEVGPDGRAVRPIEVHSLSYEQIRGRALMIHAHGETPADPNLPEGGGNRIACGVVGR